MPPFKVILSLSQLSSSYVTCPRCQTHLTARCGFFIPCLEPWTRRGTPSDHNFCLESLKHNNRNSVCLTALLFLSFSHFLDRKLSGSNSVSMETVCFLTRQQSVEEEKNKAVRRRGRWLTAYSCFMLKLRNFEKNGGLAVHFIFCLFTHCDFMIRSLHFPASLNTPSRGAPCCCIMKQ